MSVNTGTVNENSAATLLDQLQLGPDVYATRDDIASITVKSFDTDTVISRHYPPPARVFTG